MSDLHAVAHAAWDAQWCRETPPTRAEALAAVADAVEAAVRESIAREVLAVECGWVQYQRMPQNTTHIAYVHENGAVYDPERGWLDPQDALLENDDPLISRNDAARIARRIGGSRG